MCGLCESGGRGFHSTAANPASDGANARAEWTNPGKPGPDFGQGPRFDGPREHDGPRFDLGDFGDWFNGPRPGRDGGDFDFDWGGLGRGGSLTDTLLNDQLGQRVEVKAPELDLASNYVISDGSETQSDAGPGAGEDGIAGNSSTADVLTIGAPAVTNHINFNGDEDWYQVTLEAGHYYVFTMDPQGSLDAVLELISTNGSTVLASSDGPLAEDTEVVTFYAETSGTYYINADGFQTDIGTYTLEAEEAPLPSPLDAINWGGDANIVPGLTGSPAVIKVYFAPAGTPPPGTPGSGSALAWSQYEIDQAMLAFQQYANVIDVVFEITTDINEADFKMVLKANGGSTLGQMGPPNTGAGAGIGVFYQAGFGWDEAGNGGLEQGGFGFVTLVHEIGHAMGMAHPHDNGGGSGVMLGVSSNSDSGLFGLNQSLFTIMSYLDAWDSGPNGGTPTPGGVGAFGFMGTLGAFDIAMMQIKYGANTTFNNGDTVYDLSTADAIGSFYQTIWDTGGIDEIRYTGANDATINLNAATLDYSETGGGSPSYSVGVHMAYTIANGVVIENATGGFGNDNITGNTANNELDGGDANDVLSGGDGDDTLIGGTGSDTMNGGAGDDTFVFAAGDGTDSITGFVAGGSEDSLQVTGYESYTLVQEGANLRVVFDGSNSILLMNVLEANFTAADINLGGGEPNVIDGTAGPDDLDGTSGVDQINGLAGDDILDGAGDNDELNGGDNNDTLIGGFGDDLLRGGNGADTFLFNAGLFGNDTVADFANGSDLIQFSGIAGVDDFSDLVVTANGGNALITLPDGSTIMLTGISDGLVDASDFVFGP